LAYEAHASETLPRASDSLGHSGARHRGWYSGMTLREVRLVAPLPRESIALLTNIESTVSLLLKKGSWGGLLTCSRVWIKTDRVVRARLSRKPLLNLGSRLENKERNWVAVRFGSWVFR
jgi:hypothetical protein